MKSQHRPQCEYMNKATEPTSEDTDKSQGKVRIVEGMGKIEEGWVERIKKGARG